MTLQCRDTGLGIHQRDHRLADKPFSQPRILLQGSDHARRFCRTSGFQHQLVERRDLAIFARHEQIAQGGGKRALHHTTNTATGQQCHGDALSLSQMLINADIAQLIDHHGKVLPLR